MTDDLAAIRFGYGAAGSGCRSEDASEALARLRAADVAAARRPAPDADAGHAILEELRAARRAARGGEAGAEDRIRAVNRAARIALEGHAARSIARILDGADPLRERLVWFWTDHLAVAVRNTTMRALAADYVESAIRPHVSGRFEDMLIAATLHPLMLLYLDARSSVGPASPFGARKGRGLNENHARELLELHTLGVDGGYAQGDVRELAELMTGLGVDRASRFVFRRNQAEPGAEEVLGRSYGGDPAKLAHIEAALGDLARHPATARHLARKLAVHFVSEEPPAALVSALERAWSDTGGDLMAVYEVLVTHDAARAPALEKIRPPFEWIAAALAALDMTGDEVEGLRRGEFRKLVLRPMGRMGQEFMNPPGPDGWPEAAARWAEPQSLAERVSWAMTVPSRIRPDLPDPRAVVERALPCGADEALAFAAGAAEARRDGVGLVLVSPALLRR